MIYLEILVESFEKKKDSIFFTFFKHFIRFLNLEANPEYEGQFNLVAYWLLEFNDENSVPTREIGLDIEKKAIILLPLEKNYGYWTDNNLVFGDFCSLFKNCKITKEYFVSKWEKFPK